MNSLPENASHARIPPPAHQHGDDATRSGGSHDTRFVLHSEAVYLDNLAALWATDAALARQLEAIDAAIDAGAISARVDVASAEPAGDQELDQALSRLDPTEHFAFHVHGFGPHVRKLFDRAGGSDGEAILAVFEPQLPHLAQLLSREDYSDLLRSRRLLIFPEADGAALAQRLAPVSALVSLGLIGLSHQPSVERDPAFFEQARRVVADYVDQSATNVNTALQYGRKTSRNVVDNLAAYAATPDLSRLKDAFAGKPAIIVSAGPSLRRNIARLRDVAGRAVIIAVQTTLRPLLEAGIVPQFVTALDHHEISTRFYENLPPDLETELVAEPKVAGAVLRTWGSQPGRKLTLLGNEFAEGVLAELNLHKPTLPPGATVAHLAFSLAEHLGCSTAILVGQDLGFSDGLAYTPGTSYDDVWRPETGRFCSFEMKQWEHIARDRAALRRVEDWRGASTYTEQRLFAYLQQFERMFAATAVRVIDATEGGVAKAHTERMTLAEALATFCNDLIPSAPDYPAGGARLSGERLAACFARRQAEANQVAQISRQTLPLLRRVRENVANPTEANATIAQIDVLRRELREVDQTYRLIMTLTQRSEQERFRADRRIQAAGIQGAERQRRQLERDLTNVEAVLTAAEDFASILDDASTRLRAAGPTWGQRDAA